MSCWHVVVLPRRIISLTFIRHSKSDSGRIAGVSWSLFHVSLPTRSTSYPLLKSILIITIFSVFRNEKPKNSQINFRDPPVTLSSSRFANFPAAIPFARVLSRIGSRGSRIEKRNRAKMRFESLLASYEPKNEPLMQLCSMLDDFDRKNNFEPWMDKWEFNFKKFNLFFFLHYSKNLFSQNRTRLCVYTCIRVERYFVRTIRLFPDGYGNIISDTIYFSLFDQTIASLFEYSAKHNPTDYSFLCRDKIRYIFVSTVHRENIKNILRLLYWL